MENRVSVWKANLNNGIILGLAGVVFTLVLWFTEQTTNNSLGYIWFLILAIALFFMIKAYRNNYMRGFITYGQSLGAGVVIMLYYAIIAAIFSYILYKFLDPGLIDKMLMVAEETMIEQGIPESALEQGLKVQKKLMTPGFMAIASIFSNMLIGTIIALLISIFTRREGNPLIDDTIEEQIEG